MKKIKTAEEYLERFETEIEDGGESGMFNWLVNAQYEEMTNIIKQVQLDMLEYAVSKCAENANLLNSKGTTSSGVSVEEYEDELSWKKETIDYMINKQSILKTIDEIKEELKV